MENGRPAPDSNKSCQTSRNLVTNGEGFVGCFAGDFPLGRAARLVWTSANKVLWSICWGNFKKFRHMLAPFRRQPVARQVFFPRLTLTSLLASTHFPK